MSTTAPPAVNLAHAADAITNVFRDTTVDRDADHVRAHVAGRQLTIAVTADGTMTVNDQTTHCETTADVIEALVDLYLQ